jgi:hypothetical protein
MSNILDIIIIIYLFIKKNKRMPYLVAWYIRLQNLFFSFFVSNHVIHIQKSITLFK